MGNAFGQYGMDNRMPTDQFLGLPKGDRRKMQVEGLQKFGEAMNLIGAQQSGNAQRVQQAQNTVRQRMLDEEDAKRKAEIEAFLENNPQYRQAYKLKNLLGISAPDRKILQGKDGFNYYTDGTRVLPNVTAPPMSIPLLKVK